jgi:hypothetical protein
VTLGYDLHIVSNALPAGLADDLAALGYERRIVLGGDRRVRIRHLFTQKRDSRQSADAGYDESVIALQCYPSFVGYIEEEAIVHYLNLEGTSDGPAVFPVMLQIIDDQGIHKKCDIHITTADEHSTAVDGLCRTGFYRQRLEKPGIGPVSVVTVQSEGLVVGKRLWKQVLEYLSGDSTFRGTAKFEVTIRLKNFGFRIPPVARPIS